MGFLRKVFLLLFTTFIVYLGIKIHSSLQLPPLPNFDNEYWGRGKPTKDDIAVRPFKINVPDQVLEVLQQKLNQPRSLTPPLEGIQQQYGMNTNLLKEIIEFWKTKYNWREREKFLNQYPQFQTTIQGLNIHFLHIKPTKSSGKDVVPLLMLHGWPGSIREFYEVIPLLTAPQADRDFVFEIIVPSLPGYGFSEAASKPGLAAPQIAAVFKKLMERLGFKKFYIQGGDWGAIIASHFATLYPESLLGLHSNMCGAQTPMSFLKTIVGSVYPSFVVEDKFKDKMYPLSNVFSNLLLESGYFHLQTTKPDTIGVALGDSPVGLAAYILEKFTTWTNPDWKNREDGGLKIKYTYTNLLDNVMIYWVTGSITTSMRLYAEEMSKTNRELQLESYLIVVPSACARFPYEIMYQSDCILKDKYTVLVQTSDFPTGGHFAAFEEPKVFSEDVWLAVQKFRDLLKKK
ncbi:juvenile hormone epoxide hydrolase 1-like [Photinus pyralis]|uniref:juvenile hormone epoxide hydrolase 1-like n=1 Tax=Photinus pyralis TaxID=7054 RepID=UPI0012671866|nr:juvenile hormone epoxide hydrolase 1-like [Photinus pyralis]